MLSDRQPRIGVDSLSLNFGGIRALIDVSLEIRDKEILAIIGPNGAGKTALLNSINGFYKPQRGEIYYDGQQITRMRPDKVARLGIARTFQNIELYTGLSTQDNIMAARHILMKQNFLTGALYFGWAHQEEIKYRRTVEDIIDFLEIEPVRKKIVGVLPYGMRERIELKDEAIDKSQLADDLNKRFQDVCRVKADKFEFVPKGTIPEEHKKVVDERTWE